MSDLLDRLDELDSELVDTDAGWSAVHRRVQRGRTARRGLAGLAAVALVATGVLAAGQLDDQESTQVTTEPVPPPGAIELEPGWNQLPELPIAPRINPAITELDDGDLFVWGGFTPGSTGLQLFDGAVLDAESGEWDVLPPAPEIVPNEADAIWTGGQVVVMPSSGTEPFVPLVYDIDADTWTTGAAGPDDCSNAGLTWTGEEAIVVCGLATRDVSPVNLAAYDPAADRWRALPDPPIAYADGDLVWADDVLVAFGRTEDLAFPAGDGAAVTYDPSTDRWAEPFRVPVNAQATSITWTGEEIVVVDYSMDAGAFDPATGEVRELPPVPLRFYECYPEAATAGTTAVAALCSGSAALGPDDAWAPFLGPNPPGSQSFTGPDSIIGAVGGEHALYTAAFGLPDEPSGPDTAGSTTNIWAYVPPDAVDGGLGIESPIPLGVTTFSPPDGAAISSVELVSGGANETVEASVELADGATCIARSGYVGLVDEDGVADGDERVEIATADGWTGSAAVGRSTPAAVTVAWYWNADLGTDRQEATCPTLEQAVELARGFDSPA